MKKINFLDCTLRDGGYYNSWDFEQDLTNEYLLSIKAAGVNIVELGFRSISNENNFKGAHAYTKDVFIKNLNIPKNLKVGVMINASEINNNGNFIKSNLLNLFPVNKKKSPVDLVRIASHFKELDSAISGANLLLSMGYKVGLNIMQIGDKTDLEIEEVSYKCSKTKINVLYFADSLGNMNTNKVLKIINGFRKYWNGDLGIHTHDNMSLAITNSLFAIENGVNWIDSTVTGMGRGPGNAQTELLAVEIADIKKNKINLIPLLNLIETYFDKLKSKHKWGTNSYYYLSGKHGIHPSYIQEMLMDIRFNKEDIFDAINQLKLHGGKSFSKDQLTEVKNNHFSKSSGTWNPSSKLAGKDVLLIAPGTTVYKHLNAIESYIRNKKPIVIALNAQKIISEKLIDFRVASHPMRIVSDLSAFSKIKVPLILPKSLLSDVVKKKLNKIKILNYGLELKKNEFSFNQKNCIIPSPLVLSYLLALVSSGMAKKLLIAGVDGYTIDDPRKKEIDKVFEFFNNSKSKVEIISVTPTLHALNTKSIYSL